MVRRIKKFRIHMPEMSVVLSDKAPKFICHLSLRASRPPAGRRGSVWRFSSLRRCFLMSTDSNWHLKKNKHYVKKKRKKKKRQAPLKHSCKKEKSKADSYLSFSKHINSSDTNFKHHV